MTDGTDSPATMMATLQIVEAISLRDSPKLEEVLRQTAAEQNLAVVLLSMGSFAEGLLRMIPDWQERLREWMIATELDTLNDDRDT